MSARFSPPALRLLAAAFLGFSCAGYGLEGKSSPQAVTGQVSMPERVSGEGIDLRESGCELPAATVFIVRVLVHADGSTGVPSFTKGEPSECIVSFVESVVADWVFEPAILDEEPVDVFYTQSISTRD